MRRLLAIAVASAAVSCTPALREPPSIDALAARPRPAAPSDAATLLRDADAAWARRPDVTSVGEAEALYLHAAQTDETGIAGLIGAVRAKAWLADRQADAKAREALAVSAVQTAQWCTRRDSQAAACDYWLAIAVGLQAREMRSTADDGLKTMVAALQRAIERDPSYDEAGPDRIMAIVLTRAPSWPLGPGDVEGALEHAQTAVALKPDYPPNVMALAEALAAAKQKGEARDAYARARASASTRAAAGDPDAAGWIAEIDTAVAKIKP